MPFCFAQSLSKGSNFTLPNWLAFRGQSNSFIQGIRTVTTEVYILKFDAISRTFTFMYSHKDMRMPKLLDLFYSLSSDNDEFWYCASMIVMISII